MSTLSAAQAIGDILKSPDDLHKLPSLRKKLAKEQLSIQSRLSAGVKDQLDATRDGLRKFVAAKANLDAVEEEMRKVERICLDPANEVKGFKKISRVSHIHRNFSQTEEMVKSFQEITSNVSMCENLLQDDIDSGLLSPQYNLLPCHYQLLQLEAFRNETLHQAKKGTRDELETVKGFFERLDAVVARFDARLWELAEAMLELAREGRRDVIVKLLKIVEVECREDEKAAAMKLIKRAKGDVAAKFKSMQAEARTIKHYRHKLIKVLTTTISSKFDAAAERDPDPASFLSNLGWIYNDFLRISDDISPCFPPDYSIYATLIKLYHAQHDKHLRRIIASEPEASVFLQMHAWVKEYKTNMAELEITPEWISPPLLDGKEQQLVEDYVGVILKKMEEWTSNLMRDEEREFISREQPVEIEEGGAYGMQGAVIMFQMINQQIDLAADSGQGGVLARVVNEANRVMRSSQERFMRLVESELNKVLDKPDEAPPGLVEYVIALANDQIKSADYAEALGGRLEPIVSKKYATVISAKIDDAINGYLDVAKACTQTLIDLIFNDLKQVTKTFFAPSWYVDRPIGLVVETMRDYLSDYQEHLNPSIFDLLLDDIIAAFLVTYLVALRKSAKLRMNVLVNRMRDDIGDVFKLFSEFKPKDELELSFEVVELVLGLLEASKEMFVLSYWPFAQAHGPNLTFVEALLKARDDMDRSAVNETMETLRRKVKEDHLEELEGRNILTKINDTKGEGLFASFGFSSLPSLS